MFVDAPDNGLGVTTAVQTLRLFNAVQQLLSAFPSHATPISQNIAGTLVPGLRTTVHITHLEVDITMVGSQSNVVLVGDLYNFIRFAYYVEGVPYDGTGLTSPTSYLTGVVSGTNIRDVDKVLCDQRRSLSVQAYAGTQLVPQTVTFTMRIPIKRSFLFFSTNAGYTQWSTRQGNMLLDVVSDSSINPNPTFSHNTRIFFELHGG